MKFVRILIAATMCAALTACAGFPPSATELAKMPLIQFGQPLPEGGNYVLHFLAGTPLPVSSIVDGSLFEHAAQSTFNVTLKRDVYMYRNFASFDKQHWLRADKVIKTQLQLNIPQKDGSHAGVLHITMDRK